MKEFWHYQEHDTGLSILDDNYTPIAELRKDGVFEEGNANLIISAPEMYTACNKAWLYLVRGQGDKEEVITALRLAHIRANNDVNYF